MTIDGFGYTFNGKGEYYLLQSVLGELVIQGRTTPVIKDSVEQSATYFSSFAGQTVGGNIVEFRMDDAKTRIGRLSLI